jgi:hypothetical protein
VIKTTLVIYVEATDQVIVELELTPEQFDKINAHVVDDGRIALSANLTKYVSS